MTRYYGYLFLLAIALVVLANWLVRCQPDPTWLYRHVEQLRPYLERRCGS